MNKKILLLTVLLASIPLFLFGQSSGKIRGIIKDKATGEPLPGVNISLKGTTLGAATDVDGFYVIMNVPVGTYDIKANYIGYSVVVVSGVRVSANTTTERNYELEETAVEGQAVIITAQRPLVEKHVTQSVSLVTAENLETIPVRGFNDVIALQTSVIVQDGNIHIRGGRNEEVGFYLDGASAVNPLNNTQAVHIIQEAVEEFQVLAGGYTAEYGGANSGIIRTELKTGASDYHFSVDFQTDKFADEGSEFLGTNSFRHHIGVATLSGPIPVLGDNARFFIAGENTDEGDRLRRFSQGWEFTRQDLNAGNPANNDENGQLVGGDTMTIVYPNGFTPLNDRKQWALNGTLLFDNLLSNNINFRVSGAWSSTETGVNRRPQTNILNTRNGYVDNTNVLLSGKLTHVVNPKTFYDLTASFYRRKNERKDDWFGGDWQSWFNGDKIAQRDASVAYRKVNEGDAVAWLPPHPFLFNGIPFAPNGYAPMFGRANPVAGGTSTLYRLEKETYFSGSINFVSQIGRHHEVKAGASTRRYTARKFELEPVAMQFTELAGNISGDPTSVDPVIWATQSDYDGYGYDIYGNEIDNDQTLPGGVFMTGPKNPVFSAVYVQDKVEFSDLIINAGLRLDIFDTDDIRLITPDDPDINGDVNANGNSAGLLDPANFKEVGTFKQVSPRIGVSFPVSEKTVFYAQYGKFIQMPELNDSYYGNFGLSNQLTGGGNFFIQPIGFGLEPIKTTSYELGFRQQLGSVASFDVAGFFRNDKGQITVDRQKAISTAEIQTYAQLVNGDFSTTKGLDLKLTLRRTNRIQGQVNYTLTKAEGSGSGELSFRGAVARNVERPTLVNPLDFSQTHTGAISLDYRFGRNDGGSVLQQLGANALLTFNSGHPFTFTEFPAGGQFNAYDVGIDYMLDTRTRKALEAIGSSTTSWNFNVDLRLDKTLAVMDQLDATIYLRVTNLFNSRNELNVYQATGNADDDGFFNNPNFAASIINANGGEEYVELYNAINTVNGGAYHSQILQELWGHPRQIFFGLKLNY